MKNFGYLLKEGIKNIWTNRTMSLASVAVLMSCLLMTGAAVLFSWNIKTAMSMVEGNNSIKVYIKQDVPTLKALKIGDEIRKLDNVATCDFVSKEDGMKEMKQMVGEQNAGLLDGLEGDNNWLPDTFRISMKDLSKYKETAAKITSIEGVDKIYDYQELADKLTRIDHIVTNVGLIVVAALSLVSLFIIANTIRVAMYSRRLEISIMKSVGATNWFIRVPFLVEGMVIGVAAGGVAAALLNLVYYRVVSSMGISSLFNVVNLNSMMAPVVALFMLIGALFGAVGGIISIGRYLKKEGGSIVGW
ncbi:MULTISPECIES: permease-like cell division protein FtsX [Caproicibacterium]|uniref:Cell division protein FtsX n=1 Tax=Caproicibacterium argilliputei TaxID=3030016 RepID=A0AA97H3L9_9FIRM|nr:permease-like cell division protein FtsX [Caproicibacterium argilliputei]WOC32433.1 permease-like cell division protein FtsX [Caproicibacterium argilliputei]